MGQNQYWEEKGGALRPQTSFVCLLWAQQMLRSVQCPHPLATCRKEGAQVWRQGGVNVCLETSVLGTLLFSGPGADYLLVPPLGKDRLFCPWGGSVLIRDEVAMNDVRRSRGGCLWPWGGVIMLPVALPRSW